tara:strand:+ start:1095 stop:2234 length:1140 start_codon:yes stop_codon:yes gene_type:complete
MTLFNKNSINGKLLFFLIALMIITLIVSFFIEPGSNYNSYPYLIAFLILFFSRPISKTSIYLFTIIILYSLVFDIDYLSSRLGYMLTFSLTCISLYVFPFLKLKNINEKQILKFVTLLCYSIIVCYYFTSVMTENIDSTRYYFKGFIIPHQFSYFMSIFVYFFFNKRKYYLAIIPIIYTFYVGTRTGLVLIVFIIIVHFYSSLKTINVKTFTKVIFFIGLIFVPILSFENPIKKQLTNTFDLLNISSISSSSDSQEATDFTSNRNYLIIIGLTKIANEGDSTLNIFGRGPRSSYIFIEDTLNWKIWFHNDFLEIVFSLGFLHFFLYLYLIYNYSKRTKSFFFLFFVLISGLTNGFFFYTSFVLIGIHYLTVHRQIQITN